MAGKESRSGVGTGRRMRSGARRSERRKPVRKPEPSSNRARTVRKLNAGVRTKTEKVRGVGEVLHPLTPAPVVPLPVMRLLLVWPMGSGAHSFIWEPEPEPRPENKVPTMAAEERLDLKAVLVLARGALSPAPEPDLTDAKRKLRGCLTQRVRRRK
jgi:hypothetical protein